MKEIGEKLRETREEMGISLEEAAEDLRLRPKQIENIEAGEIEAFKDIFYLKYFIRDYSKYLGLDFEEMVNEFNEFLFDYTSKISLEDIKNAQKKEIKKEEKKIVSPYTMSGADKPFLIPWFIYVIIILLIVIIGYITFNLLNNNDSVEDESVETIAFWEDL